MSGEMRLILGFNTELSFFLFPPISHFPVSTPSLPLPCAAFDLQQLPHFHAHSLSIYLAAAVTSLSPLSLSSSQRPLTSFQFSVHSLSMCLIFFFEAFEMYFDPHSHKSPDGLAKILWVHLISYSTPFPCEALRAKCRLNKQFSEEQRMRSKSA